MTTPDATPYPIEDPEQIGRAFGEVFDLVDETVKGITDAEVEERLRQLLADTPIEPVDLDDLGRMLSRQGWNRSRRLDPTKLTPDLTGPPTWDEAGCALQTTWEQVAVARDAADAALREAAEQIAAADAARQQAEAVTTGVNAYVDAALDRAERILTDARAEAARLVSSAEQQADEIVAAARTRAVPAEVTPLAGTRPKATFSDSCIVLVDTLGSGKTTLATALRTIRTVPDADHCGSLADALWQPTGVRAAGFNGAAVWDHPVQQVRGLLTGPAGPLGKWVAAPADPCRDRLATLSLSAEDLHEALRASAAAAVPTRLTGSYRRAVQMGYRSYARRLELDLGAVVDEPDVLLASHHGRPDKATRWERLWTVVSQLGTCGMQPDLGVDIDGGGEDRPQSPAGIRVVDQCGSACQHVVVQVKRYDREAGRTLPVPASTPVWSLLVLYMCAGAVPDWPSLPVLDLDELRDCREGVAVDLENAGDATRLAALPWR